MWSAFAAVSMGNTLGWAASQLDRALLGLFGGTHVLGTYNFTIALSRNTTDAINRSASSVLRTEFENASHSTTPFNTLSLNKIFWRELLRNLVLITVVLLGLVCCALPIVRSIARHEWLEYLPYISLLMASAYPALASWLYSTALVYRHHLAMLVTSEGLATVFSILIAYAAMHDFRLACYSIFAREACLLIFKALPNINLYSLIRFVFLPIAIGSVFLTVTNLIFF